MLRHCPELLNTSWCKWTIFILWTAFSSCMFTSKDTQKISHGFSTSSFNLQITSIFCVGVIYTQILSAVLSKHFCQYGLLLTIQNSFKCKRYQQPWNFARSSIGNYWTQPTFNIKPLSFFLKQEAFVYLVTLYLFCYKNAYQKRKSHPSILWATKCFFNFKSFMPWWQ